MNLDHAFADQTLQQLASALIGWLISRSFRALRRRVARVVVIEAAPDLPHVLLTVTIKIAASRVIRRSGGRRRPGVRNPRQRYASDSL